MNISRYRDSRELFYFTLAAIGSTIVRLCMLFLLVVFLVSKELLPFVLWTTFFYISTILSRMTRVASLKRTYVRINDDQFPDIAQFVSDLRQTMEFKGTPELYLVPHSVPSARAMTSNGCDILFLSTGLIALTDTGESETFRFVTACALGQLALRHPARAKWTSEARFIPFLGATYSRSCVRSADAVGAAFAPEGAITGLCMLASGPNLLHRINIDAYINYGERPHDLMSWLAEHLSQTPFLPGRIRRIKQGRSSITKPL